MYIPLVTKCLNTEFGTFEDVNINIAKRPIEWTFFTNFCKTVKTFDMFAH